MSWPGSGDGLSCHGLVAGTDYLIMMPGPGSGGI